MIIPKRDAKSYGAVHIDNYLTFTGFCKKVDSAEIQDVDVYIDKKKVSTIKANRQLKKIEQIYDIEGHGFEYNLEDKYFDKSYLLEFKIHETDEELLNSGIRTIPSSNKKFNEYLFLNTLNNKSQLKIQSKKSSIGFLATEKNLLQKEFVDYLHQLFIFLPNSDFKVFYFNENDKKRFKAIFSESHNSFSFIIPKNISCISNEIDVFIINYFKVLENKLLTSVDRVEKDLLSNEKNILTVHIHNYPKNFTYSNNSEYNYTKNYLETIKKRYKKFGIPKSVIEKYPDNFMKIFIYYLENKLNTTLNIPEERTLFEISYLDMVGFALLYTNFREIRLSFFDKFIDDNQE